MYSKLKVLLLVSGMAFMLAVPAKAFIDKVDIRDYGAVGMDVAADSAAVAAAWQVVTNTGAPLFIPPGTYYVTNNLAYRDSNLSPIRFTTTPRLSILGAGSGVSTLVFLGTNSTFLSLGPHTVQVTVRDLAFKDRGGGTNRAIASVQVGGPCLFENCVFEGFQRCAVDMDTRAGGYVYGCGFSYNRVGLRLGGYSDGWTVDTRLDGNIVGIEISGPSVYDPYTHHANASRVHVVGSANLYSIVVGRCSATRISGYMESCTNAFVSIGHPPEVYPSMNDSYVGTVEIDGMVMYNIVSPAMTNGVAVYTKPYSLTVRNSQYTDDADGALVHVMNPAAEGASYSFEDVVCLKALLTSSGLSYKTQNGVNGPNWLHISSTGEYRYYASNYSYQGDNWTRFPGQLSVNVDPSQTFGVANFFGGQSFQVVAGSLTNANAAKVSRMGAFSYQGDAYPLTLLSANNASASSQELYVGGGTAVGRPISAGSLYAGSPSGGPSAGNVALKWYNDGSVSVGSSALRPGPNSLGVGANLKVLGVVMARRFVGPISGMFIERGTLGTNAFDAGALALLSTGGGDLKLASSMVSGGLLRPDLLVANPDQTTNAGWMVALSNGVPVASSDGGALTNLNAGALVGTLPSSTRYDIAVDGFQTADATPTFAYTNGAIPPNSIVQLDVWVIGTGRTRSCAFHLNAALSTLGGSLVMLQQSNVFAYASDQTLSAIAAAGDPGTSELRIVITGAADEAMNWKLRGFINSQGAP